MTVTLKLTPFTAEDSVGFPGCEDFLDGKPPVIVKGLPFVPDGVVHREMANFAPEYRATLIYDRNSHYINVFTGGEEYAGCYEKSAPDVVIDLPLTHDSLIAEGWLFKHEDDSRSGNVNRR